MTRCRSGALPPLHCYGRLALPPEQLGEETLEEEEVEDEDLATGAGPGVPGEERRHTTLQVTRGGRQHKALLSREGCLTKPPILQLTETPKSKHHTLKPACRYA